MGTSSLTIRRSTDADRADVIVPAAIVLQTLMAQLGIDQLQVPGVGLKDGVTARIEDSAKANSGSTGKKSP